ncbi:MAG: hypothetical protein KDE55_09640, partial [Novosphingobium sp.]|nr:hypothetical protein [Novosphingobium sp.]
MTNVTGDASALPQAQPQQLSREEGTQPNALLQQVASRREIREGNAVIALLYDLLTGLRTEFARIDPDDT